MFNKSELEMINLALDGYNIALDAKVRTTGSNKLKELRSVHLIKMLELQQKVNHQIAA